jgi:Ni,Fe-hydrogenase III small subunit
MLTLLRDLRQLRHDIALPRPTRGRSLAIRHVDAGSCNGCEHELTLASSPYYDLQRFGLGIVASPRHADVLLVTGPVTSRMRDPLLVAYNAMPEPRRVAALGDCALGCNLLGTADNIVGPVDTILPVDLRIAGCPPTPDAIAEALLGLIDAAATRRRQVEQRPLI